MELLGHLLKETNRIGYQRTQHRRNIGQSPAAQQYRTLIQLLSQAKHTNFGLIHQFENLIEAEDTLRRFKQTVPISNYQLFYDNWLHEALEGKQNVIWPGKISYFAKSSGTSGSASKFIPVSGSMLKQFRRTTMEQIANLHQLDLSESFYGSKVLILGGSTDLERIAPGIQTGDLSGILAQHKSPAFTTIAKPGRKTARLKDWNEKIERIVQKADRWNIGVISGVPSWVALLMERIISYHRVNNIHEIWPNLRIYVHGGVFIDPYRQKLDKLFGQPVHYQNTFLASEGYFAFQHHFNSDSMELLTDSGIFYEFVEESYFPEMRIGAFYGLPTVTLNEVVPGKRYAMVITTCSGLWRYSLEDIIEFASADQKSIRIVGRLSQSLNMCGEHLSEVNMVEAIEETARSLNISVEEFCVHPSREFDRHNWYIGTNQLVNINQFTTVLNDRLAQKNDDYASARKYLLKTPKVKMLPIEKFYEFMLIRKNYGSQHKFPRVMQAHQVREWEIFLTNSDQFRDLYSEKSA